MPRSIFSYNKVRNTIARVLRNRCFQLSRLPKSTYLNVGCGWNTPDGFINLDYEWHTRVDLVWDLAKPLPFADNSMDGIYTEHCLEHVTHQVARFALSEFRRVLKPSASLRVIVPDAELYFGLYAQFKAGQAPAVPYQPDPLPPETTPLMAMLPIFFDHQHRYGYDFETMALFLKQAGFQQIERASFRQGKDALLLIDDEWRKVESLYVEAVKG